MSINETKDAMGQNLTNPKKVKESSGIIPDPFLCDHSNPDEVVEVYRNDSGHPNYLKCNICGSEFPVIGDTDKWEPVMVDYDKPN